MKSIKNPMSHEFYSRIVDDTTIMVYRDEQDECWEIYYKRKGYPFMFAFGLPLAHTIEYVFDVACSEGTLDEYSDMF